jgi:hypothetical protein
MRFDADRLVVEVDESGRILDVAPRSKPGRGFLAAVDLGACRADGVDVRWAAREVAVDADEIAVQLASAGLEVGLRHSFSTGWTTRLLVVNPGAAPRDIERLQLTARPAPGQQASALAAGSRLCWAVQAGDGEGPLLAARLAAGAVAQVTKEGFELGPLRLAPGQRYVLQLRWELFATPRSVVAGPGRDVLVTRTAYEVGEAVLLPEDPDTALLLPTGVVADPVEDAEFAGREVSAGAPGRHRVELRSAEADVRLDLSWVESVTEQLGIWATTVLSGPRTGAGVVAVADLAAAVVLQAALGAGAVDDADQAEDALDRLTAQLLNRAAWHEAADPLAVLYLLGEHGRSGDADVFDLALSQEAAVLAGDGPAPPGLGLAVLRTVLAGVDADERVAPLVLRAVERASAVAARPPPVVPEATRAGEQAAELELLLAVRPLLPDDHPAQARLVTLVRSLGASLGAGLPGRLLTPPPTAVHAHLVAVLRMLPEDGVPGVTRSWGASPSLLAHRLTLEVLDRLAGPEAGAEAGAAAAWLALVQRHA